MPSPKLDAQTDAQTASALLPIAMQRTARSDIVDQHAIDAFQNNAPQSFPRGLIGNPPALADLME